MSEQLARAQLFNALHVPGAPLILTNVWDAISAATVAKTPGVQAIATASHSVSYARGVEDGEGLTVEQALDAACIVVRAVELPVSVDFEKGYAPDAAGVQRNVERLIATGAVGLNIEDSVGASKAPLFDVSTATARVAAARAAGAASGIPIVINARVDTLAGGGEWSDMVTRANAYLDAGADVIFVLGLSDEANVARAIADIGGRISVIGRPGAVPLRRLGELGVCRVSFGPYALGLALSHLRDAAALLTALGEYPPELGFEY